MHLHCACRSGAFSFTFLFGFRLVILVYLGRWGILKGFSWLYEKWKDEKEQFVSWRTIELILVAVV